VKPVIPVLALLVLLAPATEAPDRQGMILGHIYDAGSAVVVGTNVLGQGFYFSKPLDANLAGKLLAAKSQAGSTRPELLLA
jgi:hypothetical protein